MGNVSHNVGFDPIPQTGGYLRAALHRSLSRFQERLRGTSRESRERKEWGGEGEGEGEGDPEGKGERKREERDYSRRFTCIILEKDDRYLGDPQPEFIKVSFFTFFAFF